MNCKLFTRLEVAEALAIIEVAKEVGKDPAKLTPNDVSEIRYEIGCRRRPEIIKTLFDDEPLFRILDGRIE